MRKDKQHNNKEMRKGNLQGYHHTETYGVNYAFQGFRENLYFTSDRAIKCDANFNRVDGKPLKGYGLEIETNFILSTNRDMRAQNILSNIMETAIFPLFPANLFKQQTDCTITGTECITQVMTKEFIRNHYKDFKTMWNDAFPMFGISTASGVGMHVNVSVGLLGTSAKTQEENCRKLFYIINHHYDLFKIAFNRTGSTDWCRRMTYSNAKTLDVHCMSSSHSNCFNGSHFDDGRIEIRLVGGQKNYACFRNTMETLFHIIGRIKELSWAQLDSVVAIFSGCNQYVFDRLKSNCFTAGTITQEDLDAIRATVKTEELL
jgi:hypothetical protein